MKRRYLVTGCAGFIGSKVTEFLLDDGCSVMGIDNLNDAYDVRLKEWRLARIERRPGFEFARLDIRDRQGLRELSRAGFDGVINLGARAGVRSSVEDPWEYYETNVTGTLNLLEMCKDSGVSKFVLASTASVYGPSKDQPYGESAKTDWLLSPYAASKKAAETLTTTYHFLHGLDVTVLRYFNVYGPAGRPDSALYRFVHWISEDKPVTIYGDGTQSRDFTYVDDIARGTVAALKGVGHEIINLGSDSPVVLLDVVRLLEDLLDRPARLTYEPAHPADVPATWADIGKAHRILGWRPRTTIKEGARAMTEWYMENREWARQTVA